MAANYADDEVLLTCEMPAEFDRADYADDAVLAMSHKELVRFCRDYQNYINTPAELEDYPVTAVLAVVPLATA